MLNEFWAKRDLAAKKGVKILSAYVAVTEHTYYITVQAKDYQSLLEFFEPWLRPKPVRFIRLRQWMNGQSTSIRKGRDEECLSEAIGDNSEDPHGLKYPSRPSSSLYLLLSE